MCAGPAPVGPPFPSRPPVACLARVRRGSVEPVVFDLARFQLSDLTRLGAQLRAIGAGARSMEDVSQRVVRLLYDVLADRPSGGRACLLVRLYLTASLAALDDDLRTFATTLMPDQSLTGQTRCLTLMATAGDEPRWNDRRQSAGHRVIPLPSPQVVHSIPMIAQLLKQLGLDVATVVAPDRTLVLELEQRTYNVFFVPDAVGSPFIPAQEDFVRRYGVRSVLGFGGLFPTGDVFAVLMFTRTLLPRETADLFRNAALNVKVALLPWAGGRLFS